MPLCKPGHIRWNRKAAAKLLPGCQGAWYFNEQSGATCFDATNPVGGNNATLQGTAAQIAGMRQSGQYGRQLGGFSASNYGKRSLSYSLPKTHWLATLCYGVYTGNECPLNLANAGVNGAQSLLFLSGGALYFYIYDNVHTSPYASWTGSALNDGKPHVYSGQCEAVGVSLYVDGQRVAGPVSLGSTVFPIPITVASIGVQYYGVGNTVNFVYPAPIVAAGFGSSVINHAALAANWLSGRVAEIRPRRRSVVAMRSAYNRRRRLICCGD